MKFQEKCEIGSVLKVGAFFCINGYKTVAKIVAVVKKKL